MEYFFDDLIEYHSEHTKIKEWNLLKSLKQDESVETFRSFVVN